MILSSCATASFSKYKGVGRIKRYEIYSEQVPDSFNGFRIAFASDFHYEISLPISITKAGSMPND